MKLRVLMEPRHGATYDRILAMARAAEEAGFDGFFRGDHYLGIDAGDADYLPTDSWTTLAGLARDTSQIRLGTLMTAGTFRNPAVVAISVATVDQMSGGRVCLGIGTGWYEREHRRSASLPVHGGAFRPPGGGHPDHHRPWTTPPGETFSFDGRFWQLEECANFPALVQRPRPDIVIGGTGPRRTPLAAARYADEFNSGGGRERPSGSSACAGSARRSVATPTPCVCRRPPGHLRGDAGRGRGAARAPRGARSADVAVAWSAPRPKWSTRLGGSPERL